MNTPAPSTVLIVDDNPANLLALEAALAPLSLDIVKAGSGKDALRCVLRQTFDLVLLDVMMPGMDGFETARRIRERDRNSQTPIAFLTAFPLAENMVHAYAAGAAEYIEKPIDATLLRSKVAALLSERNRPRDAHVRSRAAILVVDDKPSNLMAIEDALASLREDVVTVNSGEAALKALEDRDYAVVLLDVVLPWADGFETAGAIRNHPRIGGVPIILMSAMVRAADAVARGYAVGAVDFLFTPTGPDILRSKVSVFVDLYRKRLEAVQQVETLRIAERLQSEKRLAEEALRTREEAHAREMEASQTRASLELAESRGGLIAELDRKNRTLTELNQELERFSRSVSHDLRVPMRAIHGFSRALEEDCGPQLGDVGTGHLRRIKEAVLNMSTSIDALLSLSRLNRAEMQREAVSLSELGRDVVVHLRAHDPNRDVEVTIEDGLEATGDPRMLRSVLENLLGNAWKFTARCPAARIELVRGVHEGQPAFIVRDNGAGFDMAYAGRLFGPFQRLHSAEEFEGTGIGLATVQRIVHRHGGHVWGEGTLDGGATFSFTLPEADAEAGG